MPVLKLLQATTQQHKVSTLQCVGQDRGSTRAYRISLQQTRPSPYKKTLRCSCLNSHSVLQRDADNFHSEVPQAALIIAQRHPSPPPTWTTHTLATRSTNTATSGSHTGARHGRGHPPRRQRGCLYDFTPTVQYLTPFCIPYKERMNVKNEPLTRY